MAKDETRVNPEKPTPEPLADPTQQPRAGAAADPAPAAQTPDAQLDELKAKASERDDYKNRWLRAVADFDNYQKRARREQERFREDALRDVLKDLVVVVDNLELALQNAREDDSVAKGVKVVKDQLLKLMAARGAEPLGTKTGEPFDPDKHEAVMVEAVPGLARDEVGMVAREGYRLGSTVLRPASVQVKKAAPASTG